MYWASKAETIGRGEGNDRTEETGGAMTDSKTGATFFATIHQITSRRDGGGRIVLEFGSDALDEIQWAQKIASLKSYGFQIAMVPVQPQHIGQTPDFDVDMLTGEIII